MQDSFKTIQQQTQGLYKDKGSRFISFGYPVESEIEIKEHLQQLHKKYHDARHICYAFRIGTNELYFRLNDDGEPSGTAGKPIFGQITSNQLTNILIVVIRYFGGILLGTPGLIKAYKAAAADCLLNAVFIEKTIDKKFKIQFNYNELNQVMKIVKEEGVEIIDQTIDLNCSMNLAIRQSDFDKMKVRLSRVQSLQIHEG